MQLLDHKKYAAALRDQAIADFQCVEYLVLPDGNLLHLHAALAKMQQVEEKMLKGYLLFENAGAFNPFYAHDVVRNWKDNKEVGKSLDKLIRLYKGERHKFLEDLESLEVLALAGSQGIGLEDQVVVSIRRNTEYPFHAVGQEPTYPAKDFRWDEVARYRKVVRTLIKILSKSTPFEFTAPISRFVDELGW